MNTEPASPSWRKYLTFSVRGLIALVLVIGLGLGWIVRNAHIQRDAVAAIRKAGGQVWYDFDPKDQVVAWYELSGWKKQIGESIGIDYVAHVVCVRLVSGGNEVDRQQALPRLAVLCEVQQIDVEGSSMTDGVLAQWDNLKHLNRLSLWNTSISDAGLTHIRAFRNLWELGITDAEIGDDGLTHLDGLVNLKVLSLRRTGVTDAGLLHLKGLTKLSSLDLSGTQVTDRGLAHLKGLSTLSALHVQGTHVTDVGLAHLKGLTKLTHLFLLSTHVTDAGVKELKQALPNLAIYR